MELSNFELVRTEGDRPLDYRFFAEVDVTTGFLWWKKTERKTIVKPFSGHWFFLDTGEFTQAYTAEALCRAYAAKTGNKYL